MMRQRISTLCTALLIITQPLIAQAEMHGGGYSGGGRGGSSGGARGGSSGGARAGASRSTFAASARNTHFQNTSAGRSNFHQGGFDFTGEIHNSNQREIQRPTVYRRPSQNQPGAMSSRTIAARPADFHGSRLPNRHIRNGAWSWNRGEIWHAAPGYWGGGFWGPFALADLGAAVVLGSLIDAQNQAVYQSYEVLPDTPGSELLADYSLTQTSCGQPNLVIIWGPDNSLICTYPNGDIGPGNYTVDEANFSLMQQS